LSMRQRNHVPRKDPTSLEDLTSLEFLRPYPSAPFLASTEPESPQRQFLENAMQAMLRSPHCRPAVSDVFELSSLDVVIHYNKKLGEGRFGKLFRGDWQGTAVVVRILDNVTSQSVGIETFSQLIF
jgi:hypothetical protein